MSKNDISLKKYLTKIEQKEKKIKSAKGSAESSLEASYLYSLLEVTHSINMPRDFKQLLELVVDSAMMIAKAERGFLMLFRKDGNLEFEVTRNIDRKSLEGERFKISRSVVNQVLATNNPLFLNAIYANKKFKISESMEALGLRMVMCVPLKVRDRLLGLIYVDSHSETETFTKLEERLFEAFAAQASVAIENSHLHDASVHDALTGLYNYGYLRARLEEEINRERRYKRESISFLMLDLDHFKSINDAHGHLFGNSILVKVAELIKKSVRKCDVAARYGGDEFCILMPESNVHGAQSLARRLQEGIVDLKFDIGTEVVPLTSSVGISTFPVEKIVDSESIIVEADHALYVAKGKGTNQVAVFGLRKDEKKYEPDMIGNSRALEHVHEMISKFAKTDAAILIMGETGTGKELVTNLIHQQSTRANKPLVVVNCGAIPDNLLESELFGYEKGAFTGAYAKHIGKFELANGGTIFLDEVGELPMNLQIKILRAVEQKQIDRIGSESPMKVDVRVIAATHKNLEDEVRNGSFRKDLYYRLSVATIQIPPLRERPDDIEALSKYYLDRMNQRYHRKFLGFTKDALEALMNHTWPGNVRELIHRIERAVIISARQYLDENDLGLVQAKRIEPMTLREMRSGAEKDGLVSVLSRYRWNITHAAKELGISRKTLRDLIKKHSIVRSNI